MASFKPLTNFTEMSRYKPTNGMKSRSIRDILSSIRPSPRKVYIYVMDRDEVVIGVMDTEVIREVRNIWQLYRDRRTETYDPLVRL